MTRRLALVAISLAAAVPATASAGGRLVLIPFENAARMPSAREVVMPAVEAALTKKGYEVVTGVPVQQFLRTRRIRFLDSITPVHARELTAELRADAVILGAILVYGGPDTAPEVAISATALGSDGAAIWENVVALSAASTDGAFRLGRAKTREALARRAVGKLFASALKGRRRAAGWGSPATEPRVFRSRDHLGQKLAICILPLENLTDSRLAPRLVDAALHRQLSERDGVTAISPAELRAGLVAGGFATPFQLSPDRLKALGREVGTPLFLKGTILAYGASGEYGAGPAVEIYLMLVDVDSGQIVWSGLHRRTGREYEGPLRFGALHDVASVAYRTIAELLDAFMRPCLTVEEGCAIYSQDCCSS